MPADPYIEPDKPAVPIRGEIGDTAGIALQGLVVNQDYNVKLTGANAIRIYDQMRLGDATVKAALSAMKLPLLRANWYIRPASESRQDQTIADFVQDQIMESSTRTWAETLSEILLFLDYGRMPFEIVWQMTKEGQIGFNKLAPRAPATIYKWKLPNGEPGVIQLTVNGNFEIPMEKMCVFVLQKEGDNWEGISVLRTSYKNWYMKDKLYLIETISAERQGLGIPYGKYPSGATPADIKKLEEILRNFRANDKAYLAYQADWEIGVVDMKGNQTKNLTPIIQHHDRQISKNVLAQFLDLGTSRTSGSYALSKDQSELFLLSLEAIADYIADRINKDIVKKLVDFNFEIKGEDGYPKLVYDPIDTVDVATLSISLQQLVQTGTIKPQASDEDYFRSIMGMPAKDDLAEIDPELGQDMLSQVQSQLDEVSGQSPTPDNTNTDKPDANTPADGEPAEPNPQANWTDEHYKAAVEFNHLDVMLGGPAGVPLSDETKAKISAALNKGKGKAKGKGKSKNANAVKIAQLNSKLQAMRQDAREQLLQMKAKGQKMSSQDAAKFQLNLLQQTKPLMSQIQSLRSAGAAAKPATGDDKLAELQLKVDNAIEQITKTLK